MVGRCDWCRRRKPLFAADSGALREEYLCEWCLKDSLLPQRLNDGDDGGGDGEEA